MDGCILTGPIIPEWKTRPHSLPVNPTRQTKITFQDQFPVPVYYIKAPPAGIQHETYKSLPPPLSLHRWNMPRPWPFPSDCAFQYSFKPTHPGDSIIQRNFQEIQSQYYSSRGMLRRWVLLAAWVGGIFILSACCLRCW
jgi:hypothetical protein